MSLSCSQTAASCASTWTNNIWTFQASKLGFIIGRLRCVGPWTCLILFPLDVQCVILVIQKLNIWAVLKCLNGFCKTKLGPSHRWRSDKLTHWTRNHKSVHVELLTVVSPFRFKSVFVPNSTQWQSPGNRPTPTSTSSTTPSKSSTPWGKPASSRACSPLESKTTVSLCSEPWQTHTVTHRSVSWFILKHQERYFLSTADEPCRCCLMFSSSSSSSLTFIPGLRMKLPSRSPGCYLLVGCEHRYAVLFLSIKCSVNVRARLSSSCVLQT